MAETVLKAIEDQVSRSEARMSALEQQLVAVATGGVSNSDAPELKELQALLAQAKEDGDALRRERDEAVKAHKAAEAELSKAQYRILHLARALREADGKGAASSAS